MAAIEDIQVSGQMLVAAISTCRWMNKNITDENRIEALPTIKYLMEHGAGSFVLPSGPPQGRFDMKLRGNCWARK